MYTHDLAVWPLSTLERVALFKGVPGATPEPERARPTIIPGGA